MLGEPGYPDAVLVPPDTPAGPKPGVAESEPDPASLKPDASVPEDPKPDAAVPAGPNPDAVVPAAPNPDAGAPEPDAEAAAPYAGAPEPGPYPWESDAP
jgi:hypothetical protein